jgi:SWI/SNF-related matrix-associated actin-dependent regulator of chromatin subfamily A member 5
VFRFITEGTIEEKIIERADRKLFLDAAVIQQGRLAEQNSAVGKDELMKMVRFGADEILSGKGGSYTDEDIDALILRGEERTSAMQAKLETNAQYNLASFSLLGNDETGRDTFSFGGENYRDADKKGFGNFINLPQRERKRLIHDVNDPAVSGSNANRSQVMADAKKRKKSPTYQDFQLFDNDRLDYFNKRISDLASVKEQEMEKIASIRLKAKHAPSVHNSRSNPDPGESAEELNELADRMEKSLDRFDLSQGNAALFD